jgi:hypothetical protein
VYPVDDVWRSSLTQPGYAAAHDVIPVNKKMGQAFIPDPEGDLRPIPD